MSKFQLAIILTALVGCTFDAPPDQSGADPLLSGKADITDQVNLKGTTHVGATIEGELVDDLQYDAVAFRARKDAVVTVETTHAGSAAALDDVLMVYGPGNEDTGYASATRLARDDNSGWGKHAKISELRLPEDGSYLVVIGTADGTGRGHYRISLTCNSGDCGLGVPDLTTCDGHLAGHGELCMEAKIYDDRESPEKAFEACVGEDALLDQFADKCGFSSTPPAYCAAGEEAFAAQMVPACQQVVGFEYGLVTGPANPARSDEFASWARFQDEEDVRLFDGEYDARDGLRRIRPSALPPTTVDTLSVYLDARDLVAINSEWADVVYYENRFDGFSEERELDWGIVNVYELWRDGEVIGIVGESDSSVSFWDASDPDDPVTEYFSAFVFLDLRGNEVAQVVRSSYSRY